MEGRRQAIVLNARQVYENSDGSGGKGPALAAKLLDDVKIHAKISEKAILAVQGKVTDGQYLNEGFINAMNKPVFDQIPITLQDPFGGHYNGTPVTGLTKSSLHTTMKSLFHVFCRDHDNHELNEYKIAGQDFLYDLLGLIDLLWPLVLLMLRAQLLRCPGWKIAGWLPQVRDRLILFSTEVMNQKPSKEASPRLHTHAEDIARFSYKSTELVEGWLVVSEEQGKPITWAMRELSDCRNDLKKLAETMVVTLDERCKVGIPDLLNTLHKSLDFGVLFSSFCGEKSNDGEIPVRKADVMQVGQEEFKKCVSFVAKLPHVERLNKSDDLQLDKSFSDLIFWKIKSFFLEIIWGKAFKHFFPKCFERISEGKLAPVVISSAQVITSFTSDKNEFDLLDKFLVTLSDASSFTVVLQEEDIIEMLYCDPAFYEAVGKEFCIIFDIFYAKTGTEAIAESFYRVMETQEKECSRSAESG